jgi:hypothetical protein
VVLVIEKLGGEVMSEELQALLEATKNLEMSPKQTEEQRISFAYGNTHFENEKISREIVNNAAENLKSSNAQNRHSKR